MNQAKMLSSVRFSFQLCPYISLQPKVKWCFWPAELNKVDSCVRQTVVIIL